MEPKTLHSLPGVARFGCLAVVGLLLATGQEPVGSVLSTIAALFGLFLIIKQARSPGQAARWMWVIAFAYFAFALLWILEPFQVEADIFGWMAPIALALMSAGLALFWAAAGALAVWLRRPWMLFITLSVAELGRAYLFTGFPWANLAQSFVGSNIAQLLSFVGPHGLTVLILGLIAGAVFPSVLWRFASVMAGFGLFAVTSAILATQPTAPESGHTVRIVQPNAPQVEKWDPEKAPTFFWRQVDATRADGPRPDLVVWPETAIPQLLHHADEALNIVADAAQGAPVAFGIQRVDGVRYYNSMAVMDAQGVVTQTYDKHHLVPFGEYMPFAALFRRTGIRGLAERASGGYTRGPGPQLVDLGAVGMALPLICYEAVFPQHASVRGERPNLLLQVTNDAWFGEYAGPQQHLAQARMRAIEQGLPLVRAANTGISAMIDPWGRVTARLRLGTHGHIDAALPMPRAPTLYSRTGDLPVAIMLLSLLSTLCILRLTKNKD